MSSLLSNPGAGSTSPAAAANHGAESTSPAAAANHGVAAVLRVGSGRVAAVSSGDVGVQELIVGCDGDWGLYSVPGAAQRRPTGL